MLNKYLFRRYLLFAIALFVNAMGIAYITKAALGTSPITSVTYVASMFTPLTMGQWTIVLNRGHLLGEMLAKRLGIRLYDKEFIHLAAQKSGIDEAYIRSNEQSIPSFWLKCILTDGNESSRQQQRATSSASKQPRSLASSWDVVQTTSCKTLPASSRFSAIPTGRVLTNDAPRSTAYRQTRHVPRLPASTATASPTTNTIPARNGETRTAMT